MKFLLPNAPQLPEGIDHYSQVPVSQLIELNGNHWRKILTIIAKLVADPDQDWRIVRDLQLWNKAELVFDSDVDWSGEEWVFIVGQTWRGKWPVSERAQTLGTRHQAYLDRPMVWVPYLDYRQFPNVLIDELRQRITQ